MRLLVHVFWRHDSAANTCTLLQHLMAAKGNDSMLEAMSVECCQLMMMSLKLDSKQVEKEAFRTVDLADPSVHSVQDLETLVQLPLVFLKVRSLLTLKLLLFSKPSCYMFRCSLSAVTAGKAATCIPYRNHADMVIFQTAALRGRSDDGATHSSRSIADNVTLKMQRLQQQPELD